MLFPDIPITRYTYLTQLVTESITAATVRWKKEEKVLVGAVKHLHPRVSKLRERVHCSAAVMRQFWLRTIYCDVV